MHIYFINYHKFEGASGIHIHFLANELVFMGIPCTVCVPNYEKSIHSFGKVNYNTLTFLKLFKKVLFLPNTFQDEGAIFHAWTPREIVRLITTMVAKRTNLPYFVHLEDNEEYIYNATLSEKNIFMLFLKKCYFYFRLINPHRYKKF